MKNPPRTFRPHRPTGGRPSAPAGESVFKHRSPAEISAGIPAHFDNQSVEAFAYAMRVKLAAKRLEGRGGWHDKELCTTEFLSQLLREHVEKGDPVDVANFCMMLHQRGERITKQGDDQ